MFYCYNWWLRKGKVYEIYTGTEDRKRNYSVVTILTWSWPLSIELWIGNLIDYFDMMQMKVSAWTRN